MLPVPSVPKLKKPGLALASVTSSLTLFAPTEVHHALATGAARLTLASCGLVTLLTDFGLGDPFVGVMKGALYTVEPALRVIDITHGIRPGAIREGAFWLERSYAYFPAGTVHCAVVDPGERSSVHR